MIIPMKIFTCVILLVGYINCQNEAFKRLRCGGMVDCKSCLTAAEYCVWCDDYKFISNGSQPACNNLEGLKTSGCPEESILALKPLVYSLDVDDPLLDFTFTESEKFNQIKPQKVTVGMKPGDNATIKFSYRAAKNYPLDLYYLMDLTWSMRDDKETLVGLGDILPLALQNLTSTSRFGFGSFAEKPLMPYTNMDENHIKNPCITEQETCLPTYTFAHRLSLTSNVNDFISVVNASAVTGNLDNTEAGLDALMQVAVCGDRIGWSPTAHRVVILTTDGFLHFAGNGKLGGVVRPSDEKCHLDSNGDYADSTMFDYPALDQMYRVLLDKKISVIFAVTESRKKHYDQVHELMPDITFVGSLETDSSNILNLLKQGYEGLFKSVNFVHDAPANYKVTLFSDCGTGGPLVETTGCSDIKIGEVYDFVMNISYSTLGGQEHQTTIVISNPRQVGQTGLTINVEHQKICNCKCDTLELSKTCPENSFLNCGQCVCKDGWFGTNCSCQKGQASFDFSCRDPNGDSDVDCSNNGDCFCGVCSCDRGYSGKYCGCRDCQKSLDNGEECGGELRGVCSCGQCVCAEGWGGPTCSCKTGDRSCTAAGDTQPCSGRGVCECGECQCNNLDDGDKYAGKYCQSCANCDDASCGLYEDCARCTLKDKDYCGEGVCVSQSGTVYVPKLTEDYISPSTNLSICQFWVSESSGSCKYTFTYDVQKDWNVHLLVSEARGVCSTIGRASAFVIFIMTVIAGILVIIVIRAIQMCRDRRAYNQFVSELESVPMSDVTQNPLYKSPITTVRMPDEYDKSKAQ